MTPADYCPQCRSANVIFSKKRGAYLCEDCGHVFTPTKPFVQKRLFISYGHDEHIAIARRLRDDLLARGHDVWFDEERLKPGHDWERSIEQGFEHLAANRANAAVLLLLTPHSVRRPDGFCLNEVARALSRNLPIIPIMVVESEPPLSICRIQWLDMRQCIPIHEKEAVYGPRFDRLLKALEENQLDFEGTQSRLLATLSPIQFSADIIKLLKDFTGRKWVFDKVDTWLADPAGSKIFWIKGDPGTGKSVISAWIRDHRREVAAFHFCDINSEEKRNPGRLVRSIVYQLSTQLSEYEVRLARLPLETIVEEYHEAYTLFDKLVVQPLAENFPRPDRTIVVLIDALDEATYQRQNEIVRFLSMCADKTPHWLRFLVTSRPEPEIVSAFQAFSPNVLDSAHPENLRDLSDYLSARIPSITAEQIRVILEHSEGVFLYVRHVADAVLGGQLSLQRLDEFPRGLGDVYQQFFQRQFGEDLAYYEQQITPLLQVVLAAYEPLTLGLLKRLCGIDDDTGLFRLLNRLGSLFPASGQNDAATLRPFHRSIVDWITDRSKAGVYVIAISDGHRALVKRGWALFGQEPATMDDYFLAWLPSHLQQLGADGQLIQLLKNFRYLMEKSRRGMLERLLADFRELPSHLIALRAGLEAEASFFREKAHILRRGNVTWPTYKILLQVAAEHADDSPLTLGADQWLQDGCCDWFWLRRIQRLPHAQKHPCLAVFEGHTDWINGAIALRDGRFLSWSWDKTLRVWDGQSGSSLQLFDTDMKRVEGALELANGQLLSRSEDNTLRLWDSRTGTLLYVMKGHADSIRGMLELRDGHLISWSRDGTLRIWDSINGACCSVLAEHTRGVKGVLELSGGRLLSWSHDRTLRIWNLLSGTCIAVLDGHTHSIEGALELNDGRVVSWSQDNTLRLWDTESDGACCLRVLKGHTDSVRGVLVMADGHLISWSQDNTLRLWDTEGLRCLTVFEGHNAFGGVQGAVELRNGRLLSWSRDRTIRLWDGYSGNVLATRDDIPYPLEGVLELKNSRVVLWSHDKTFHVWNLHSDATLSSIQGHTDSIRGMLTAPDGQLLSWSRDGTLRLWNGQTDGRLQAIEGHHEPVQGVQVLRDARLLSWSWDTTLRLWDCLTGSNLVILKGHTAPVYGAVELETSQLLSWSRDGTFRLWDDQTGRCLEVVSEAQARECHSDWLTARNIARNNYPILSEFYATCSACATLLHHKMLPAPLVAWHADSDAHARCILPNGTVVVTQKNGQVCFLKLQHGNNRACLDTLDSDLIIPTRNSCKIETYVEVDISVLTDASERIVKLSWAAGPITFQTLVFRLWTDYLHLYLSPDTYGQTWRLVSDASGSTFERPLLVDSRSLLEIGIGQSERLRLVIQQKESHAHPGTSNTSSFSQQDITRKRLPRVQIEYLLDECGDRKNASLPFVVGVMADLSGKTVAPSDPVSEREFVKVDFDHFCAFMKETKPRVIFQVPNIQIVGSHINVDITFECMDDFSPEAVVRNVAELRYMSNSRMPLETDSALVEFDRKICSQINLIIHHPDFQILEGAWHGLHDLVSRVKPDKELQVRVLNISKKELYRELQTARQKPNKGSIFKKVYTEVYGVLGVAPFGILVGDYYFNHTAPDVQSLLNLAETAAAAHVPLIVAAGPDLIGLDTWQQLGDVRDLTRIFQTGEYSAWRLLRDSEVSRYIFLAMPRYLARAPYTAKTSSNIEFCFEEAVIESDPSNYTWANSAYLMAISIMTAFRMYGWCARITGMESGGIVEGLPCHTFPTDDGNMEMRCPTEVAISSREIELGKCGFLPLSHYRFTDYAVFTSAYSLHSPPVNDNLEETVISQLASRLPWLLLTNRFAQYLKCIARDMCYSFRGRDDMEQWLNKWINEYCCNTDSPEAMKACRPLAEGRVEIGKYSDIQGQYQATFWIRPHYQLCGLTKPLKLTSLLTVPFNSTAEDT